jgi:hypothetical protein
MAYSLSLPTTSMSVGIFVVLLLIIGIALTFWGKRIVEAMAFVVFGLLGGLLGLWVAMFIVDYFGIAGIFYWVILIGLCVLGIVLGAWLSKSFLYGMVVFYCATSAFYITWMMLGGEFRLVPFVIALVVGLVVGIVVYFIIEKLFAVVTAFLGASLVGYGTFIATIFIAKMYFDTHLSGGIGAHGGLTGNIILMCLIIVGIVVLGILGTMFQWKGGLSKGSGGKKKARPATT